VTGGGGAGEGGANRARTAAADVRDPADPQAGAALPLFQDPVFIATKYFKLSAGDAEPQPEPHLLRADEGAGGGHRPERAHLDCVPESGGVQTGPEAGGGEAGAAVEVARETKAQVLAAAGGQQEGGGLCAGGVADLLQGASDPPGGLEPRAESGVHPQLDGGGGLCHKVLFGLREHRQGAQAAQGPAPRRPSPSTRPSFPRSGASSAPRGTTRSTKSPTRFPDSASTPSLPRASISRKPRSGFSRRRRTSKTSTSKSTTQ